MEMGEPSAVPLPPPPVRSPAGSKLAGILGGPEGPLAQWPFVLKRNGRPVGQGDLGGRTKNAFRDGLWWTDEAGRFQFEDMPEGYYAAEVQHSVGQLAAPAARPEGSTEGAVRVPPGPAEDVLGFTEFPEGPEGSLA